MHRLSRSLSQALSDILGGGADSAQLARGISGLLSVDIARADLSRTVEAFRESARGLCILEESRNGQRVYDAWCKLARFFAEPLERHAAAFVGEPAGDAKADASAEAGGDAEAPKGFEALAVLWERTAAELEVFLQEQRDLDRLLVESPVSAHVGQRIRSRILLLDKRAERLHVALELVHRDLAVAARDAAARLEAISSGKRTGGRGGSRGGGS